MTLKEKLDYHYKTFDKSKLSPDPLQFLHMYSDEKDIELIGLISSVFAYGNISQIIKILNKITNILSDKPYEFLINLNEKKVPEIFDNIYHRFYSEYDVQSFFIILSRLLRRDKSIKKLFLKGYNDNDVNLKNPISEFSKNILTNPLIFKRRITPGLKFMFPDPQKGSICKRMNLFLRWMVRKDELDFGLWKEIPPNKLVIPVDTHVARICKSLKLTTRKNADWKMAEEITENLKRFDPVDPVKYDFAICHIGMRKLKF